VVEVFGISSKADKFLPNTLSYLLSAIIYYTALLPLVVTTLEL
jgi:hypothetical protein